jgi:hypothetical protein
VVLQIISQHYALFCALGVNEHILSASWREQHRAQHQHCNSMMLLCLCTLQISSVLLLAAEDVPDECQEDVYQFMITRGKNINANIPLGEQPVQPAHCPEALWVAVAAVAT